MTHISEAPADPRVRPAPLASVLAWSTSGWRRGLVGFAVLVLALDLLSRSGIVHQYYFPPASQVARASVRLLGDTGFLGHVVDTVRVSAIGLGVTCAIGVPL